LVWVVTWLVVLPTLAPPACLAQAAAESPSPPTPPPLPFLPSPPALDSPPELPAPRVLDEETPRPDNGSGPAPPGTAPAPTPLAAFLRSTGFFGGGGFMGATGFLGGPPVLFASYHAAWFPDQPVAGQPTSLGFVREDFTISDPVWRTPTDQLTLRGSVRNESFHTAAVLPDTGQPFPDNLWNLQLGANYAHRFENGWAAGGMLSVGSASDQPFHSIHEMTVGVNAFLRVPSGEHNAWLFTLTYSPTGQLAFPIPGVAYFCQPSDRCFATIGLPFQLLYLPCDDLMLNLSYMLLTNVHAGATYRLAPQLFLHAAFDWQNESYFLAERTDTQQRLFYYDKQLSGGVRYNLNQHAAFDLTAGYVFDRFYFEGRQLSDSQFNRIDVGNGPFASFLCQFRW
jgi:hypothetical protein